MKRENKVKIKVLLVDDHPLVREGVRSSLQKHDRFEIVGEASSGPEASADNDAAPFWLRSCHLQSATVARTCHR